MVETQRVVALALLESLDDDGNIEPLFLKLLENADDLDTGDLINVATTLATFIAENCDCSPRVVFEQLALAAPDGEDWKRIHEVIRDAVNPQ